MLSTTPVLELLARAVDVSALRQSVHAANIANAGVDGYRRLEVSFDKELELLRMDMINASAQTQHAGLAQPSASVISTDAAVRLDEEVGLMAKNALRYQTLLGAFEKTLGLLRSAVREGRE